MPQMPSSLFSSSGSQVLSRPRPTSLRFLDFPAEIREQIYGEILSTASARIEPASLDEAAIYKYQLAILGTNHQVYREAKKVFQDNVFVKITTPWPEAIDHIRSDGKVPSVATGDKAAQFLDYHLWVFIDTPATPLPHSHGSFSMLICLEDLEVFTRMWNFSNLNHSGLNAHLRLKLTIQDPHVRERKIPKSLQTRLLMPFSVVKSLHTFSVHGAKLLPSVEEALTKEREIPDPSPEQCLERGFSLKEAGNKLLKDGLYQGALDTYIESFAAIHITVSGRHRTIHAEGYYIRELLSGTHRGLRGDLARMILRIQLVANVVLAYIKLEDWGEAYYWGKRSIMLFRHTATGDESDDLGDEDPQEWLGAAWAARFPAKEAMGKIFYRTALAARRLGKMKDVRFLVKAAGVCLPGDEIVQREAEALKTNRDEC